MAKEPMKKAFGRQQNFDMAKKYQEYKEASNAAKSKALATKKSSADYINAERKRQGYKPMSAKDKRIHEGMDKYL